MGQNYNINNHNSESNYNPTFTENEKDIKDIEKIKQNYFTNEDHFEINKEEIKNDDFNKKNFKDDFFINNIQNEKIFVENNNEIKYNNNININIDKPKKKNKKKK